MAAAAPKVVVQNYDGQDETLKKLSAWVRECGDSPDFQRFASLIIDKRFPRSRHTTNAEIAQCHLDYCNQNIRFRPDPDNSERLSHPRLTLCVDGVGAMCLPMEDCESTACAYLALCRASGIPGQFLKQVLLDPASGEEIHHLACVIRLDNGKWVKVDPSLKGNSKIGQTQSAIREEAIDIVDPKWSGSAGGAKFVAIGAKPRIIWEKTMGTFGASGGAACPKGQYWDVNLQECVSMDAPLFGRVAPSGFLGSRPMFGAPTPMQSMLGSLKPRMLGGCAPCAAAKRLGHKATTLGPRGAIAAAPAPAKKPCCDGCAKTGGSCGGGADAHDHGDPAPGAYAGEVETLPIPCPGCGGATTVRKMYGGKMVGGDTSVPDPLHPSCIITFHCDNRGQHCTSTSSCGQGVMRASFSARPVIDALGRTVRPMIGALTPIKAPDGSRWICEPPHCTWSASAGRYICDPPVCRPA